MTNNHYERVQFGVAYAVKHIQEIEAGPASLLEKARRIDTQLLLMLDDVIFALPRSLRAQAQTCVEARYRLQLEVMAETERLLGDEQKEASPVCLQASDSL